jgi:hypothetical protein
MSEAVRNGKDFVGYGYKELTVPRDLESLYADGYENFGWKLESVTSIPIVGTASVTMKFKRDRKIINKAELTRLQRQFDACVSEITKMEKSKEAKASITAFTVGIIGTAFMAGATFAYLGGLVFLCVVLAIPAFIGWILPYFFYHSIYAKKTTVVTPLVESKYDEIYEVCEKANGLLSRS